MNQQLLDKINENVRLSGTDRNRERDVIIRTVIEHCATVSDDAVEVGIGFSDSDDLFTRGYKEGAQVVGRNIRRLAEQGELS